MTRWPVPLNKVTDCLLVPQRALQVLDLIESVLISFVPGNYEESESKSWYVALMMATFLNYALSITGVVLLFVYYTKVKY